LDFLCDLRSLLLTDLLNSAAEILQKSNTGKGLGNSRTKCISKEEWKKVNC